MHFVHDIRRLENSHLSRFRNGQSRSIYRGSSLKNSTDISAHLMPILLKPIRHLMHGVVGKLLRNVRIQRQKFIQVHFLVRSMLICEESKNIVDSHKPFRNILLGSNDIQLRSSVISKQSTSLLDHGFVIMVSVFENGLSSLFSSKLSLSHGNQSLIFSQKRMHLVEFVAMSGIILNIGSSNFFR